MLKILKPGRALLLLLLCARCGATEGLEDAPLTFEAKTVTMYDTQPKLRIKGARFQLMAGELEELQLTFNPPIEKGEVYSFGSAKSDGTIILELKPGKTWVTSENESWPKALMLTLEGASLEGKDLIESPVQVALVIPTPTVVPGDNMVYLTATRRLKIFGTNFDLKHTRLFFSPPLVAGKDVTIEVKSPTKIIVSLVQTQGKAKWADEPGPLKLYAIDTGAGSLVLREDLGGVTIVEMQVDMKGHGISVQAHENVNIYQSTTSLTVGGEGFRPSPDSTKFRFGNTLTLAANYTVDVTESSATFTLVKGSKWRQNSAALPNPLLLLAADAGDGYVPFGGNAAKSGRKVATVYEDPRVDESRQEIRRTHTHEMFLKGTGFTKTFPPLLVFNPPIEREDYVVHVVNRTHCKISLASNSKGWLPKGTTGELSVVSINTGAAVVRFDEAVVVGVVVSDSEPHKSGIVINPGYDVQIYQSSSVPLRIEGQRFPFETNGSSSPQLTFGLGGPDPERYVCKTVSETLLEVTMTAGYQWTSNSGPLMITGAKFEDKEVTFASPGLKVATIMDDPFVKASQIQVYASYTKDIAVKGQGFTSAFDPNFKPKVVLSPTLPEDYAVNMDYRNNATLVVSLRSSVGGITAKWAYVQNKDDAVPLKIVSIDTGGGPVDMPGGGIVIASVRMDDANFHCDDSCIYANDGQCDENQNGLSTSNWNSYGAGSNAASATFTTSQASNSRLGYVGSSSPDASGESEYEFNSNGPSCEIGTDCSDCGLKMVESDKCDNTCNFSRDGVCDDRRALGVCPDGTDCQDCGPWGQSNFTEVDTSMGQTTAEAYDDDDNNFLAHPDHPVIKGQGLNAVGRYKRVFVEHKIQRKEHESAESIFVEALWAAIAFVGFSVIVYISTLIIRGVKGDSIKLSIPTNPDVR